MSRPYDPAIVAAHLRDAPSIARDLETYGPHKGDGINPQKGDIRLLMRGAR